MTLALARSLGNVRIQCFRACLQILSNRRRNEHRRLAIDIVSQTDLYAQSPLSGLIASPIFVGSQPDKATRTLNSQRYGGPFTALSS